MSGLALESTLIGELWLSFGSMLRSYVGAATAQERLTPHVTEAERRISVLLGAAELDMEVDLSSGSGSWRLSVAGASSSQGAFRLLAEGHIELEGNVLELDHAAIDLAAALLAAAKSAREGL